MSSSKKSFDEEDRSRNVRQPWVKPLPETQQQAHSQHKPRVVRPHRDQPATRPVDIAEMETARLMQEGVPLRRERRWTREDIEQISTTLLAYPRPMPNVMPVMIPDPVNGRPLYLLSQRRSNDHLGFILTVADLNPDGGGYVFRLDTQEEWSVTTYYLNYEEICCLQAAADDKRGVGHRPEGA